MFLLVLPMARQDQELWVGCWLWCCQNCGFLLCKIDYAGLGVGRLTWIKKRYWKPMVMGNDTKSMYGNWWHSCQCTTQLLSLLEMNEKADTVFYLRAKSGALENGLSRRRWFKHIFIFKNTICIRRRWKKSTYGALQKYFQSRGWGYLKEGCGAAGTSVWLPGRWCRS